MNAGRKARFEEERRVLKALPERRLDDCQRLEVRVGSGSTIRVRHNTYSVHSRLVGEKVQVRVHCEHIEVWYAQQKVESVPRLYGRYGQQINYRHIVEWLARKPGAFEEREEMRAENDGIQARACGGCKRA